MINKTLHEILLKHFNMTNEEFFNRKKLTELEYLKDPNLNSDFVNVISKLKQLIQDKKKILVYGDYDVDGITATTIFVKTLKSLNANVVYYIPSRYLDGYGLSKNIITKAIESGVNAIICVDNGISKYDEIDDCNKNNIDVIVIDHHEKMEKKELPTKYVFHQFESNFTSYNISAAFLSLFISFGLLNYYDPYCVTLAGIACYSDCMPLVEMNVCLVNLMLKYINQYRYKNLLKLINQEDKAEITTDDINFTIISKLNSLGRMIENRTLYKIVDYLLTDNEQSMDSFVKQIDNINNNKKDYVKEFVSNFKSYDDMVLFVVSDSLKLGLTGLIATRMLDKYDISCVFALNIDNNYVGSLRSNEGYNLLELIEKNKDLITQFGGHKNACGVTISKENIKEFETRFKQSAKSQKTSLQNDNYILSNFDLLSEDCYETLMEFRPFGEQFSEPEFALDVNLKDLNLHRTDNHLIYRIDQTRSVVFFNILNKINDKLESENDNKKLRIIGKLEKSIFKNKAQYQLKGSSFIIL